MIYVIKNLDTVSGPEMNLDVDAPDKVAGVLTAAATAYQVSAVELRLRATKQPDTFALQKSAGLEGSGVGANPLR